MKRTLETPLSFLGKSMLWSVLLYAVMMVAINWDDVHNKIHGRYGVAIADTVLPEETSVQTMPVIIPAISEPAPATGGGIGKQILLIIKLAGNMTGNRY